ncbi:MAG: ABC transporter permease [Opitutaceae bacterium]
MNPVSLPTEVIIRSRQSWFHLDWRGLVRHRDLLRELVARDFSARYKQTILGPAWFVINPLITTAMFIVVFNKVVGVPTDGINAALFYLSGLLTWTYFSQVLAATGDTLHGNLHLFAKVYFPRLIVPLAVLISNLIPLLIQLVSFAVIYVFIAWHDPTMHARPTVWLLAFPLLILHVAILALGVGLILSAISAKYKDFSHLSSYLVQMWMFASPIIYPFSRIPAKWQWAAAINPMTSIIESFRAMALGAPGVTIGQYAGSLTLSLILCVIGVLLFQQVTRTFVDYA